MRYQRPQRHPGGVWDLAARQHGVVARRQLLALGISGQTVKRRVASGRLHRVRRGVYAVGRPGLTRKGEWMAAVLCCGDEACLSHASAAALWAIRPERGGEIHVSVPVSADRRPAGVVVHRRSALDRHGVTVRHGIPVTTPVRTLVDLATRLAPRQLEAAVSEADKLDLVDPEGLRAALQELRGTPGVRPLRELLDRGTFRLTDSELERRFLPIARAAGLSEPLTQARVNGFRVDFHWAGLGLVVETDGLRYHRTAAQQARDRERDQAHAAAGLTALRFTHAQVRFRPEQVRVTLAAVAGRLAGARRTGPGHD